VSNTKQNGDWNGALRNILSAIRIDSPNQFTFGGRIVPVMGNHQHGAQTVHPLLTILSGQLYEYAYSRPFRGNLPETNGSGGFFAMDSELVEAMSQANATRERWEHGWIVEQILAQGQIVARQGNHSRNVWPGQFISKDGPAAMLRVGAEISIFYARESRSLQGGFYYAFGEAAEDYNRGFSLVRMYWNVSAAGAPGFVGAVTARLNRFHVPFRLKCATARNQFDRTDVAVIYLSRQFFPIAAELMLDVHPQVADFLDDDVPLFSKKVAKGMGVAEDPGTGESFGQSRCHRLAQSIWDCYQSGDQSNDGRLKKFRTLLSQSGINPDHLHLNAGSLDWYQLPGES
jgi:hypothetical protein